MILSLHWTAWLLIIMSVIPGVALALAFYRVHSPADQLRAGR